MKSNIHPNPPFIRVPFSASGVVNMSRCVPDFTFCSVTAVTLHLVVKRCPPVVFSPPDIKYALIGGGLGLLIVAGFIILKVCMIRKQAQENGTGEVMIALS